MLDAEGAGHLPAGYLDDPDLLTEGLSARLGSLTTALRDLDPAAVTDTEVHRFLTGRTLWQRGGLRDRVAAGELADRSVLRRRNGHPCVLVPGEDRLRVLLGDRELVMPTALRPALQAVRDVRPGGTLLPADLAEHLDEQSRLVVCRRLVREGLLEVVG